MTRSTNMGSETARLAALRDLQILDTPPEPKFDRLVAHAARIFNVATALVSLVDDDRQWFKARHGLDLPQSPRSSSFCAHAIEGDEVMVVPDATLDARFVNNPHVTGNLHLRFYAGAPLITPEGHRLGTLCVLDPTPREMTRAEQASLRDLAAITVDELFLHREIAARVQAETALREQQRALLEAKESVEKRVAERTLELTRLNETLETEIQRREHTTKAKRLSEQRFRQLFDQASDAAFVHDEEGRMLDVNMTACTSLGYTRDELLKMTVTEIEATHVPGEAQRLWRELSTGETGCFEGRQRCKDGRTFPVEVHVSVMETPRGRRLLALVRDIGERKRTEALLRTRARQQEAVTQLGNRALSGGSIDALLHSAIAAVRDTLGVPICRVHEHLPEQGKFVLRAGDGLPGDTPGKITWPDHAQSVVGHILRQAKPMVLADLCAETRFDIAPELLAAGVQSCFGVSIGGRNAADLQFGVLGVSSVERRDFTEDDVTFVQSVANVLAAAIARQRGEDALHAVEARYQRIAANTPGMVYQHLTQLDGTVVLAFVSEGCRVVYGLEPRQLYDNPQLMVDCVHPDDRALLLRLMQETILTLAPLHWEGRHLLPDGTIRWMRIDSRPERLPDGGVMCDGIVIDITAQTEAQQAMRESEERFRRAILHSPFPVMLHTSDGQVLQVNDAWTHQTGYLAKELTTLEAWLQRAYPAEKIRDENRRFHAQWEQLGTVKNAAQPIRCANGEVQTWDFSSASLGRLPDGRWLCISTAMDVTERHRGEVALRRAKEEAERANAAKSGFLSRMSHELRTPLNAILGFGQVLELSEFGEQDAQCVYHILKAGRHLLSLVDEVLDLARVDTGELSLRPVALSFDKLAQECASFVARLAQARRITCHLEVSPAGQVLVWADEQRLRQVLLNLLANAIKYNHEGGSVILRCEPMPDEDRVRLKVTDTGPGIPPESFARLFIPFERLGQQLGPVEGTGLGLVVSKQLVEAMGGRMGVDSQVGLGSTFWVELPAPAPAPADETTSHDPAPLLAPAGEEAWPATLLYVEDNVSNLQVVKTVVARLRPHWQLLSAQDGETGLRLAREHRPDLVLLDLQLPDINGDDLLLALRADAGTRHLPVLLLSADATTHSRDRLLTLGADDYLSKPFNVADLLEKLDQRLHLNGADLQPR